VSDEAETTGLRIAGFDVKGWWFAAALPVLSGISGTIYYAYDVVNRFWAVEENVVEVLDVVSRVQTIEQAIQDNDVRGLAPKLSQISTQMGTILEQQKELMDLRSKVEKSESVTSGIDAKLEKYNAEIEDLWKAMDDLVRNPMR
jgi:predicted RNase H-like nuclease (RuvC/YqgF family)